MIDQFSYVISPDCPIACLGSLLSRPTVDALLVGVEGSPARVGQVVELYEQNMLREIYNIGSGRAGEIRRALAEIGLIDPEGRPPVGRRHVRRHGEAGHVKECGRREV
jgi:hypothetical protein